MTGRRRNPSDIILIVLILSLILLLALILLRSTRGRYGTGYRFGRATVTTRETPIACFCAGQGAHRSAPAT